MRLISAVAAILVACIPSAFALPTKHDTSNEVTEEGMPPVRSLDETLANLIDTLAVEADGSVSSSKKLQTFQVVDEINDELTDSATADITKKDKTTKAQEKLSTKGTKQSKTGTKMPKSSKCTKFKGMIKTPKMPKDYAFMRVSLKGSDNCSYIQSFFEDNLCMDFNLVECSSVSDPSESSFVLLQVFDTAADSLSKHLEKNEKMLNKLWMKKLDIKKGSKKSKGGANFQLLSINDIFSTMIPSMQPSNFPSSSPSSEQLPLQFSSGGAHACALFSTEVKCIGKNYNGQRGLYSGDLNYPNTLSVSSSSSTVKKVVTGSSMTCMLMTDGTVYCNGGNHYGQLGDGTNINSPSPVQVKKDGDALTGVTDLSEAHNHICAIYGADNKIYCWGENRNGKLGFNDTGTTGVKTVVANYYATCLVKESNDSEVVCKGGASYADFNNKIFGMGQTITKLTSGAYHVCALLEDQTAKCFGYNGDGQLGNGSTTNNYDSASDVMQDLTTTLEGITDINAGGSSTCLVANSKPMCFGFNYNYQLGIANGGADVEYPTELDVTFPAGVEVVSVHVNQFNGYAVMSDNSVYSWGTTDYYGNDYYGLGQGNVAISGDIGDTDEESAVEVAFGEWGS